MDRYWSNASKIIVIDICYVCGWICSYLPVSIPLLLYILCNWSGSGIFYSCLFSNYFLRKLWVLFLFFLLATFYIVLNLLDLNNLLLHYTKLDEAPLLLFSRDSDLTTSNVRPSVTLSSIYKIIVCDSP